MAVLRIDDPTLTLGVLMGRWPGAATVLLRHRMMCPACPFTRFFTLAEACARYDLGLDAMLEEMRAELDGA